MSINLPQINTSTPSPAPSIASSTPTNSTSYYPYKTFAKGGHSRHPLYKTTSAAAVTKTQTVQKRLRKLEREQRQASRPNQPQWLIQKPSRLNSSFTSQFCGVMYRDTSLNSYSKSSERQAAADAYRAAKKNQQKAEEARKRAMLEEKRIRRLQIRTQRLQEKRRRDSAATKVQTVVRGRQARRKIFHRRQEHYEECATRIQNQYRSHRKIKVARRDLAQRREVRRSMHAASKLQSSYRNYNQRKASKHILERKRRERQKELHQLKLLYDDECATHIQKLYRGRSTREKFRKNRERLILEKNLRLQEERFKQRIADTTNKRAGPTSR
eukprot:g856.t1